MVYNSMVYNMLYILTYIYVFCRICHVDCYEQNMIYNHLDSTLSDVLVLLCIFRAAVTDVHGVVSLRPLSLRIRGVILQL